MYDSSFWDEVSRVTVCIKLPILGRTICICLRLCTSWIARWWQMRDVRRMKGNFKAYIGRARRVLLIQIDDSSLLEALNLAGCSWPGHGKQDGGWLLHQWNGGSIKATADSYVQGRFIDGAVLVCDGRDPKIMNTCVQWRAEQYLIIWESHQNWLCDREQFLANEENKEAFIKTQLTLHEVTHWSSRQLLNLSKVWALLKLLLLPKIINTSRVPPTRLLHKSVPTHGWPVWYIVSRN